MSTHLTLSLFGKPIVILDGGPSASLGTTKAQALFYYLATTGAEHSRHELAYLLWPSDSDEKTKNSLRVALTSLRRSLADHLTITRETVAFDHQSPHRIDVHQFDRYEEALNSSTSTPSLTSLTKVIELYNGDFLEDFHIDGAPEFENWLLNERERRRQVINDILSLAVDGLLANRRYEEAKTALRRQLDFAPWDERLHLLLMETLSRLGDFNGALTQYQSCVALLAEELDAEPSPETDSLYQRIQAARSIERYNLPPEPTAFVGRKAELAHLHELLTSPDCRLVTITGLGGIGKTRLALAAARQICQEEALLFLNGVVHIRVGAIRSSALFPSILAEKLGLKLGGSEDPITAVMDYLENKEILLVLDGFETLVQESIRLKSGLQSELESTASTAPPPDYDDSAVATIGFILEDCPDVRCLITSRQPLGIQGEHKLELHGLDYPKKNTNVNIEGYSAIQLFLQGVTQVRPGYQLPDDEFPHVVALCQLLGGMPLGIKLAASWLRAMSTQRVVSEISNNLDFLSTRMRDVDPRQRSMRAVLDYTWELLSDDERSGLGCLAVFAGSFSQKAAFDITDIRPATLKALIDHSLLQTANGMVGARSQHNPYPEYDAEPSPSSILLGNSAGANGLTERQTSANGSTLGTASAEGLRYTIHQIVRHYGAEKLAQDSALQQRIASDHCAYYVAFLNEQIALFSSLDELAATQAIAGETENIRAAWNWSVRNSDLAALEAIISGLSVYFQHVGPFQEAEATCRLSLEQIRSSIANGYLDETVAQPIVGKILVERARFLNLMGQHDLAIDAAEEVLAISTKLNLPKLAVPAHYAHSRALFYKGNVDTAFEQFHDCIQLAHDASLPDFELHCRNMIGLIFLQRSQYAKAREAFENSLSLADAIRERRAKSHVLNNLGVIAVQQGDYESARVYYEQALTLSVEIGDRPGECQRLNNLGRAYSEQRRYTTAASHFEHALVIAREIDDPIVESNTLLSMGRNAIYVGNYTTATEYLAHALEIKLNVKDAHGEAEVLIYQGLLLHLQGNNQASIERSRAGRIRAQEANSAFLIYFALTNVGHALADLNRLDEATDSYAQALTGRQDSGHRNIGSEPLAGLVDIAMRQRDEEADEEALTQHLDALLTHLENGSIASSTHGTDQPFRVYWIAYQALLQLQPDRASTFLQTITAEFHQTLEQISDPTMKDSFCQNVAIHKALLEAANE